MEKAIIIEAKSTEKTLRWAFTKSMTGQLDFAGKTENVPSDTCVAVAGSTFFSGEWYEWLPENLCAEIAVHIPSDMKIEDSDTFAYLTHVGALLLAVEEKDSLLAAELFERRAEIFMRFPKLTLYIIEPVAAEALFAWIYGSFNNHNEFSTAYHSEKMFNPSATDTGAIFYEAAKKRLLPKPQTETPEEMFVRFFREQKGISFTIGTVGAQYHPWAKSGLAFLEKITRDKVGDDFVNGTQKVAAAKNELFKNISCAVQAEPYNPHDANAVSVLFDGIEAKIRGKASKKHAGYIRATGAAILRKAFPQKFAFKAELARLGSYQDGSAGIVVRVEV